jgi:hypothetical protein
VQGASRLRARASLPPSLPPSLPFSLPPPDVGRGLRRDRGGRQGLRAHEGKRRDRRPLPRHLKILGLRARAPPMPPLWEAAGGGGLGAGL